MHEPAQLDLFFSLVLALFWEAAPFLLLGSLVGAVVECYLSREFLARHLPQGRVGAVFLGLGAGMILPTCECGVVPVVRRLLDKGVPPTTALTYMLAAPVINPVVLISTYVAFQGQLSMLLGRVVLVAITAGAVGFYFSRRSIADIVRPTAPLPGQAQIQPLGVMLPAEPHPAGCECGCGHDHTTGQKGIKQVLVRTAEEFMHMSLYLLAGALAAAASKAFLPVSVLTAVQDNLLLSVVALMALAVLLSVCSEADAFVAASFLGFPPAAQLSFIALGPMLDLKLLAMFGGAFRKRVVLVLAVLPTVLVFVLSIVWGWLWW
ncbi:MAG: permease [Proteobacteria bacterium]|nr:permease [Pseudomonadota bacterium]MBU4384620.1 permease [Pseudomonadota bacterium]MBU4603303.1 permease [Pseudomonadota bacterium]MCG2766232.1 permease [Desulfarculaceae bacterium]